MPFLAAKVALLIGDEVPGGAKYVVRQSRNQDEILSYERTTQEKLSLMADWSPIFAPASSYLIGCSRAEIGMLWSPHGRVMVMKVGRATVYPTRRILRDRPL